jgi:homogentisate 1,2-dioxygenase
MFAPITFGNANFEERITRRDGAWSIVHLGGAPGLVTAWTPSARGPHAPVEALPRDATLTRRTFRFESVPSGGDPIADRLAVLFNDHLTVRWISADSASPTSIFNDGDGDQLVCVLEGGASLESVAGSLRVNPAEHVFIPRGLNHRWKVDKLGLRALVVEFQGELSLPRTSRNDYGQLSPEGPLRARDLNVPHWPTQGVGHGEEASRTLRRDRRCYDGSPPYDSLRCVGFEGSIYPASFAWEAPFVRSKPRGAKLFEHERCDVFTTLVRDDESPFVPHGDLVSLTVDSEGSASLVWEPRGVTPMAVGAPGAIAVQVCAHDPLRLTANGALLLARDEATQIPR